MQHIIDCRTAALGGEAYRCEQCQTVEFSYHSCGDRHCPKCGNDKASAWLETQQALLLPVPYFFLTFTVPDTLHSIALQNQEVFYDILFDTAAAALKTLGVIRSTSEDNSVF